MPERLNSSSERETEDIAYDLAARLKPGDIIALNGEMGAGKTAFVRGLARFLAPEARVSSPTFALVNQYGGYGGIYHFDMYRIDGEADLLSVGFFDYLGGGGEIIVIEWFGKIRQFFDGHTVEVDIIKSGGDNLREIIFERVK